MNPVRLLSRTPLHVFLVVVAFLWLIPTLGLLITSFRTPGDIVSSGWWTTIPRLFQPGQFTLGNYLKVLNQEGLGVAFRNSLFISVPSTLISVIVASLASYGFACMGFPGRRVLLVLVVALMVVPLQMTFIPILPIYRRLRLAGTYPGIWLAHTAYGLPLTTFLMYSFMSGIPKDLFDSASIDGAGPLKTFFRIVLPISVPALASVFIFQFLWIWNDLLVALVYVGATPRVAPITVAVANLVTNRGQNWELLTAAAFLTMILPLVVFFSLQRYFVRGILAGAIKG